MTQNWSLDHCKLNLFPQFSANQLFWELFGVGYLLVMSLPSLLGYTLELYLSQNASNQWKSSTRKHTTDIFLLHCTGVKPWTPTWTSMMHLQAKTTKVFATIWELSYFLGTALWVLSCADLYTWNSWGPPGGSTPTFSTAGASRLRSTNPGPKPVGFRNFNQWGPSPYKFDTWPRWSFDKNVNP